MYLINLYNIPVYLQRFQLRTLQARQTARQREQRNMEVKLALMEIDKLSEHKSKSELTERLNTAAQRRKQARQAMLDRHMQSTEHALEVRLRRNTYTLLDQSS